MKNVKSPSKAPEVLKSNIMKTGNVESPEWVNVHDDELMVELGIRLPNLAPKDPSVWTKTPHEKKMLKSLRRTHKGRIHFYSVPRKSIPVRAKLIVQLKKNKNFPNTTYSTECWQHEIEDILLNYYAKNSKTGYNECLVSKYIYNGKTYVPSESPFWPGA